jgi:hypothetical protein
LKNNFLKSQVQSWMLWKGVEGTRAQPRQGPSARGPHPAGGCRVPSTGRRPHPRPAPLDSKPRALRLQGRIPRSHLPTTHSPSSQATPKSNFLTEKTQFPVSADAALETEPGRPQRLHARSPVAAATHAGTAWTHLFPGSCPLLPETARPLSSRRHSLSGGHPESHRSRTAGAL